MGQYFSNDPNVKDRPKEFTFEVLNRSFHFQTNDGVFAKSHADLGSLILVKTLLKQKEFQGNVLDLGCGYGTIGIVMATFFKGAKYLLVDVNARACALARVNAKNQGLNNVEVRESNSFENIDELFDTIITNPPIRAGKKVIYEMFSSSYNHLTVGGKLYFVIRKNQGANTASKYVQEVFNNCTLLEREKGYHVYEAIKNFPHEFKETKEDLK